MSAVLRFLESHEAHEHASQPWGHVILASLIIQLTTFSGLLLTCSIGCFSRMTKEGRMSEQFWHTLHRLAIPSFAGGALLSTVVFLLVPESIELLKGNHVENDHGVTSFEEGEEHDDEDESYHWKFGTAFLGGFLFPIFLSVIFPPPELDDCEACRERAREERAQLSQAAIQTGVLDDIEEEDDKLELSVSGEGSLPRTMKECCDAGSCCDGHGHSVCDDEDPEAGDKYDQKEDEEKTPSEAGTINWALATSILVGDAFHNFVDGIFLGNAFALCSQTVAYTLIIPTVYHELAQEIADFAMLTHHCGMSTRLALFCNFVSGFSTLFGAILILALDLSETATGALLAVSAGVYGYVAAVECMPRVQAARKTIKQTLLFLLCFAFGAVPIGLVLLNHGHCEAEEYHAEEYHEGEGERFL